MNVNPEDLIPKRPDKKDLQPYPTREGMVNLCLSYFAYFSFSSLNKSLESESQKGRSNGIRKAEVMIITKYKEIMYPKVQQYGK